MIVYHRKATIFAGIFTTVQGALWSFITVYSIGVYGCIFDFPFEDTTQMTVMDLFYYSYFYGDCRYPDLGTITYKIINPLPHRTYILMIVYGILSAVWIPSSVLILVIAVNKIHGKRGSRCYWPWIVTTGMLSLLDIAASIIYIIDITNSLTTKDYQEYFHYYFSLQGMDGLTVVPAILMTVLSSRAVIIWIINVILFFVVIQASRALRKLSPAAAFVESDARMTPPTTGYGKTSSWVHIRKNPTPQTTPQEIHLPRLSPQISERRPERPSMLPLDGPTRPRPALKPLSMGPPSSPPPPPPTGGNSFMINSPPPIIQSSPSSPFYDVYGKPTTPDSPQPSFVRTRNPVFDPNIRGEGINNNIPWSYMNPNQPQQSRKAIPDPDYTIHPKRSSPPNTITPSDDSETTSFPRRPEGVNNKIPWSYMSPQVPKTLPEPDYTIRQKYSPPRSTVSEDGDVFTPTKRFENNPNVWKVM